MVGQRVGPTVSLPSQKTSRVSFTLDGTRLFLGSFTTGKSPSGIEPMSIQSRITIQESESRRKMNGARMETAGASGD